MKRGSISLPLHYGRTPRWLFLKMKALSAAILEALYLEEGTRGILLRISDPIWFQALGCLLGFDWHSSGLTTTTTGALKESLRNLQWEIGLFVAGGKGKTSKKTPEEIESIAERTGLSAEPLIYASRLSAKVDNSALQDGYQIYHHAFFFTKDGDWAVVQQGMNPTSHYARRYHWLGETLESFVKEPHSGILSARRGEALNLVARESSRAQGVITELAREEPTKVSRELKRLTEMKLPERHTLLLQDLRPQSVEKILLKTYLQPPQDFERLLATHGVGPKTLRALALLSDLLFGTPPSYKDPFVYSYAHGGKDGTPYPVDREVYLNTIETLEKAIKRAKVGQNNRIEALKRLGKIFKRQWQA